MTHLLETLPHPAIIAHRGASRYAPQNTLAAFQLAVDQQADGIEFDVRLSADGIPVVIHDASVRHTTNGRGWVANMTLAALRKLDAGQGETIPTLDEVLETVGGKLLLNIELKPLLRNTPALAEKVAQAVHRYHLEETVICSSFSPPALSALARSAPGIPRGVLLPRGVFPARLAQLVGRTLMYQTLHPDYHDVLGGVFPSAHHPANRIFTYTVNEDTDMRQLFALGVNIFTDDPLLAQQVRGF
ncbi:MAG: glycerophosphodiester phosphodiesterase [Anaerolineales bacterium]|nr:glycerophosphodiester phosphodiesterase [Anaerolineales bacterium]